MTPKHLIRFAALALMVGVVGASAQQGAPTENKGLKITAPATLDLGPEIPGMDGRQLRLRVLTLEPGGVIGIHSHKDRPAVVHLVEGTLTVHTDRGDVRDIAAGTSWSENKDTVHWAENRGTRPVVFIAADVLKP
jgi:quercetin dioxygenase-like cupin family protein